MTSEQLFYDKKTGFDRLTDEDKQGIQTYAEGYKNSSTRAKPSVTLCWKSPAWLKQGFRAWTRDDTLRPARQDLPHQPPQGHHAGCYW